MVTQQQQGGLRRKIRQWLARHTETQLESQTTKNGALSAFPGRVEHEHFCRISHVPRSFVATKPQPRPDPILERAAVVPVKLPCRLSLGIDKEIYYHKEIFDLIWQQNGQVKECQKIGQKYIQKKCGRDNTYYLVSQRYSIMEQVPPRDQKRPSHGPTSPRERLTGRYSAANRPMTANGQGYVEKELFTQDITASAAWEEYLPEHVVHHLMVNKKAVLYLQIVLHYESFVTKTPCTSSSCTCAYNIGGDKGVLRRHRIESCEFHEWFFSGEFLDKFFYQGLIKHLIDGDKELQTNSRWKAKTKAERENFVSFVREFMVRIFATCIHTQISLLHVFDLAEAEKKDADLPISRKSLPSTWDEGTRDAFYEKQFKFKAFMFTKLESPSKIPMVSEGVIMPFLQKDFIAAGGYGDVYRVRIHKLHHSLTDDRDEEFAMKVIKKFNDGESCFKKEIEACEQLSRNPHKHITPLLTAWQDERNFYMLFPKARFDLHDFLLKTSPTAKSDTILWLLQQMRGLAKALEYIHSPPFTPRNAKRQDNEESSTGVNKRKRIGRHRDLKPKNIFVFSEENVLKIGDFGLAVIREKLSGDPLRPHSLKSKPVNGDWEYGAPENYKDGSASGRGDLWSLGCVYMEMLLWFFRHEDNIEEFWKDRLIELEDLEKIETGAFWRTDPDGKHVLRAAVKRRFSWLREQASTKRVLRDLVELVEKDIMIPDAPEKRFSAPQICSELKGLLLRAKDDLEDSPNFYDDTAQGKGRPAPGVPSSTGVRTTVGDDDHVNQALSDDSVDQAFANGPISSQVAHESHFMGTPGVVFAGMQTGSQFD